MDCPRGEGGTDFLSLGDVLECLTGEGGQEGLPLEGALRDRELVALGGQEKVALGGRVGVALGGREEVALGGRDECGVGGIESPDFSLLIAVSGRDALELLRSVLCPVKSKFIFQFLRIFVDFFLKPKLCVFIRL